MKRILLVIGAVVALVLGTSMEAQAITYTGPLICNSGPKRACVQFAAYGDIISVWDTDCDGHAAVAEVKVDGYYNDIWNHHGCGTRVDYSYGTSVREGIGIWYRACSGYYTYQTTYACSGWGYTTT